MTSEMIVHVDGEIIDLLAEADEAYKTRQEVITLKQTIDKCFLDLGQRLCTIRDRRWYMLFDCETFDEYIDTLSMSRGWAFQLARIHQKYRVELEVPDDRLSHIGVTKLAEMAGHITEKNKDYLLDIADEASVADVKRELGTAPEIGTGSNTNSELDYGLYYLTKAHGDVADELTPVTKRVIEVYKDESGQLVAKV